MDQAPRERRAFRRSRPCTGRIAALASAASDVQELLKSVHAAIAEQMPARNFYIALHDTASDVVSFPYFVDERDPTAAGRSGSATASPST
jgi:hypothetical protein